MDASLRISAGGSVILALAGALCRYGGLARAAGPPLPPASASAAAFASAATFPAATTRIHSSETYVAAAAASAKAVPLALGRIVTEPTRFKAAAVPAATLALSVAPAAAPAAGDSAAPETTSLSSDSRNYRSMQTDDSSSSTRESERLRMTPTATHTKVTQAPAAADAAIETDSSRNTSYTVISHRGNSARTHIGFSPTASHPRTNLAAIPAAAVLVPSAAAHAAAPAAVPLALESFATCGVAMAPPFSAASAAGRSVASSTAADRETTVSVVARGDSSFAAGTQQQEQQQKEETSRVCSHFGYAGEENAVAADVSVGTAEVHESSSTSATTRAAAAAAAASAAATSAAATPSPATNSTVSGLTCVPDSVTYLTDSRKHVAYIDTSGALLLVKSAADGDSIKAPGSAAPVADLAAPPTALANFHAGATTSCSPTVYAASLLRGMHTRAGEELVSIVSRYDCAAKEEFRDMRSLDISTTDSLLTQSFAPCLRAVPLAAAEKPPVFCLNSGPAGSRATCTKMGEEPAAAVQPVNSTLLMPAARKTDFLAASDSVSERSKFHPEKEQQEVTGKLVGNRPAAVATTNLSAAGAGNLATLRLAATRVTEGATGVAVAVASGDASVTAVSEAAVRRSLAVTTPHAKKAVEAAPAAVNVPVVRTLPAMTAAVAREKEVAIGDLSRGEGQCRDIGLARDSELLLPLSCSALRVAAGKSEEVQVKWPLGRTQTPSEQSIFDWKGASQKQPLDRGDQTPCEEQITAGDCPSKDVPAAGSPRSYEEQRAESTGVMVRQDRNGGVVASAGTPMRRTHLLVAASAAFRDRTEDAIDAIYNVPRGSSRAAAAVEAVSVDEAAAVVQPDYYWMTQAEGELCSATSAETATTEEVEALFWNGVSEEEDMREGEGASCDDSRGTLERGLTVAEKRS